MYLDLAKLIAHSQVGQDDKHNYGFHLDLVNEEGNEEGDKGYSAKLIFITNTEKSEQRHYHKLKKETFICWSGQARIEQGHCVTELFPGDKITILPETGHRISSMIGEAVILEVATHDDDEDTYYE